MNGNTARWARPPINTMQITLTGRDSGTYRLTLDCYGPDNFGITMPRGWQAPTRMNTAGLTFLLQRALDATATTPRKHPHPCIPLEHLDSKMRCPYGQSCVYGPVHKRDLLEVHASFYALVGLHPRKKKRKHGPLWRHTATGQQVQAHARPYTRIATICTHIPHIILTHLKAGYPAAAWRLEPADKRRSNSQKWRSEMASRHESLSACVFGGIDALGGL